MYNGFFLVFLYRFFLLCECFRWRPWDHLHGWIQVFFSSFSSSKFGEREGGGFEGGVSSKTSSFHNFAQLKILTFFST